MPEHLEPALARDRLRTRLRELRESTTRIPDDPTTWPVVPGDVESGPGTVAPADVESLVRGYGLTDEREIAELVLLAYAARTPLWWDRHGLTGEHRQFVDHEAQATRISVFQPLVVPGLLQTRAYAVAATAAVLDRPPDDADVLARVQLRGERQRTVQRRVAAGAAPDLVAVIDESVLRRPIGGEQVLRGQLDHLLTQAALAHVTLVVMPLRSGGHVGLSGAFEFLEFADGDRDMVFIESAAENYTSRSPETTGLHRRNIRRLQNTGMAGGDAVTLVRQARDALSR